MSFLEYFNFSNKNINVSRYMYSVYVFKCMQHDLMINDYNDIIANRGYECAKKI